MRRLSGFLRSALRPSLGDVVLAAIVGRILVFGRGWSDLLSDGDTGWHIRTGDWILANHRVPTTDLFSFSRSGAPWFAWEWLADAAMSLVHRHWALAGVSVLACCVIAAGLAILFRHMLWRGANPAVAFGVLLLVIGPSSIHYLARPHVFTLLLLAISLWMVERDRRKSGPFIWLLVPLSAVWVNLHGGFLALPVSVAALAAGFGVEGWLERPQRSVKWAAARRYAGLAAATGAASLINPYGIELHRHLARYLTSDWILQVVDEFLSPQFRSEGMLLFELLLMGALLLSGLLLARRQVADALLVLLWAHLALKSARHIPIFALVAAPMVAVEVSRLWEAWANRCSLRAVSRVMWTLGTDMAASFRRFSFWGPVLAVGVMLTTPASQWPGDFPKASFPVSMVQSESARLAAARVFTSDQWADFLIYHGWPQQKVFFDGRTDFYGPTIGDDYGALMHGRRGWEKLLRKHEFSMALIPPDWPLASLLDRTPNWRRVREDKGSVLYELSSARTAGASSSPGRATIPAASKDPPMLGEKAK